MLQRLDKMIASQGRYSRREAQELIKGGKVKVNGITVRDRGAKSDDEKDTVTVNGEQLDFQKFVYIMLNKPKGVVSATNDKNEKTVIDLVPKEYKRRNLFPAGRLDITTTGFVLITDDGDFAHRILSPKNHIEKTYEARLAEKVTDEQIKIIIERGGLIGLNFYDRFLGGNGGREELLRHTEHMLSLGAEDVISIGSDYDGCRIKPELRGIEKIPSICVYLEENGIPEEICKKIFFENAAHFFEKVLQPRRVML